MLCLQRYLPLLIIVAACIAQPAYAENSPQQNAIYEAVSFDNHEEVEELVLQNPGINLNFLDEASKTSPLGLIVRKSVNDVTQIMQERFLRMIRFLREHGALPTTPGITFSFRQKTYVESPVQFIHKCLEECIRLNTGNTAYILEICRELTSPLPVD